jgi:hypothetical protein
MAGFDGVQDCGRRRGAPLLHPAVAEKTGSGGCALQVSEVSIEKTVVLAESDTQRRQRTGDFGTGDRVIDDWQPQASRQNAAGDALEPSRPA